jgi:hypothetical protein
MLERDLSTKCVPMRFARFSMMSCALALSLTQFARGNAEAQPSQDAEQAQPPPHAEPVEARDILLFAPAETRSALAAALQIEVGSRGARVIAAEPFSGPTLLLRDAEAQRAAIESGAYAAARLENDATGWTVHVVTRDAAMARRTPIASDADPRTVALIIVSLLDDPTSNPPMVALAVTPAPAPPVRDSVDGEELQAARGLEDPTLQHVEAIPEDSSNEVRITGLIGSGGFGLVNDRRFIPGAMLRGGVGLNVGYFEGALMADAALMLDELPRNGAEIQPLARLCLEPGLVVPFDSTFSFHAGARLCGGFAELRITFFDAFGNELAFDQFGGLLSAGGYLAFSMRLSRSSRLYIRADLEAAWLESSMHVGEVFPVISAILSVF